MEWVDGVKLTDKASMAAAGLDIVDFVDVGIECTLRQLLEHGYFHADPHPGKCFLECSMMIEHRKESCSMMEYSFAIMIAEEEAVEQGLLC
jgi:predicted unusual protein kinase regulating ubiquinone biosynthesis (AarF/ABC1/UbiB family)